MKSTRLLLAAVLSLVSAVPAVAQIGVYAGFSGAFLNTNSGESSSTLYGPLIGIYDQGGRFISLGGDIRGSFVTNNGVHFYTGVAGPRLAIKPYALPLKPYGEALFGVASFNNGNGSSDTYGNYQLIAGIDTTILPHIDWRIVEFDYSALFNNPINTKTLTTGLVLRLR